MADGRTENVAEGSPDALIQARDLSVNGSVHFHGRSGYEAAEQAEVLAEYGFSPLSRVALAVSRMGLLNLLAGGKSRRVMRAGRRLEVTFAAENLAGDAAAGAARRYRSAVRLALRLRPALALHWFDSYDQRISDDYYPLAFGDEDAGWLTWLVRTGDASTADVVFELATRMQLRLLQVTARNRAADLLRRQSSAAVIIEHYQRWQSAGVLDEATLTPSLEAYLTRRRLEQDPALWEAFFIALPRPMLPDLFDVWCFRGHGAEAARRADTEARQRQAVQCCLTSPRLEDIEAGLTLARERLQDMSAAWSLAERAGDLLSAGGRLAEAIDRYREAGRDDRAGECYEQLGQFFDATACCPSDQPDRLAMLAARCQPDIDSLVGLGKFTEAVSQIDELLEHLDRATERTSAVLHRRYDIEIMRADLIAGARQSLRRMIELTAPAEQQAIYADWSLFEEACGELEAAAQRAEDGDDYYRASRLFRHVGRFGDADRVLKGEHTAEALSARAEAREAGGDLVGAARFYDDSGQVDHAVDLFVRAGQFGAAARSLLRALGEDAIGDTRLVQCLRRSGGYDQLVTLCMQAIKRTGPSSPAAQELRALSEEGLVPAHLAPEVREVLLQLDLVARRPFESRAQAWVAQARQETDRRFASIWGLDLGTTTCVAAIYDTHLKRPVLCGWRGSDQFAATLSMDAQDNLIVGLAGEEILASWVKAYVSGSKRKMGNRTRYKFRGRLYRPEEIAARFIRHARELVESFLTAQVRQKVSELAYAELGQVNDQWMAWAEQHHNMRLERPRVLVTIPAYFTNNQKYATRAACEIAGVELVRLIHEPTAACMAAARERGLTGRVVVVDLGAGTLDVSLLEVEDKVYEVRQVKGDNHYGGKDFDEAVHHALRDQLGRNGIKVPTPGAADRRLGVAAEELKVRLSSEHHAEYQLLGFLNRESVRVKLSRAELAEILAEPLRKLRETCTAFRDSLGAPAQHLVLVGRPMQSPLVQELIEDVFSIRRTLVSDPRTAVACGAALQAAVLDQKLQEVLLLDVTPLALGIRAMDKDDNAHFSILMDANTKIPATKKNDYTTAKDNQTSVAIEVFNGQLEDGSNIGQFDLADIPPAPKGKPRIIVTFSIDASCVLEVTAQNAETRRSNSIRITDTTLLSPGEITAMAQRYQAERVRSQQREALENVCRELQELIDEAREYDISAAWQEFTDRRAAHHTTSAPFDDETGRTLFEIFSRDNQLRLDLDLAIRPLPAVIARAQGFLDHTEQRELSDELEEAERRRTELITYLDEVRPLLATLERWSSVLLTLALTDPDPVRRFRSHHDAGNYHAAMKALGGSDAQLINIHDIERQLHCLSEIGDTDKYRSVLLANTGRLRAFPFNPDDFFGSAGDLVAVLARITLALPDGSYCERNGFVVGDDLVATSRHSLTGADSVRVTVEVGERQYAVEDIRFSAGDNHGVAMLKLAGSVPIIAVRCGYPKSVRIGDRVWAFSAATADGAQLLIPGLIDKFETLPNGEPNFFRVGIELPCRCSGGPLFNDLGEVIGILVINDEKNETTPNEPVAALTVDAIRPLQ